MYHYKIINYNTSIDLSIDNSGAKQIFEAKALLIIIGGWYYIKNVVKQNIKLNGKCRTLAIKTKQKTNSVKLIHWIVLSKM